MEVIDYARRNSDESGWIYDLYGGQEKLLVLLFVSEKLSLHIKFFFSVLLLYFFRALFAVGKYRWYLSIYLSVYMLIYFIARICIWIIFGHKVHRKCRDRDAHIQHVCAYIRIYEYENKFLFDEIDMYLYVFKNSVFFLLLL